MPKVLPSHQRARVITDEEQEVSNGYLDTHEFFEFTQAVHQVITERTSLGDIRRAMKQSFRDRWIWDAISSLTATGAIRKEWGVPSKYTRQVLPAAEKKGRRGISPARPADKTLPDSSSYHFSKHRTTA